MVSSVLSMSLWQSCSIWDILPELEHSTPCLHNINLISPHLTASDHWLHFSLFLIFLINFSKMLKRIPKCLNNTVWWFIMNNNDYFDTQTTCTSNSSRCWVQKKITLINKLHWLLLLKKYFFIACKRAYFEPQLSLLQVQRQQINTGVCNKFEYSNSCCGYDFQHRNMFMRMWIGYVGKTCRALKTRITKHHSVIWRGDIKAL